MIYDFPQPTPMIMVLGTHFTRASDIIVPDHLTTDPRCRSRPIATASATGAAASWRRPGRMRLAADGVVRDSGLPDAGRRLGACSTRWRICRRRRWSILLGSRYCETDRLSDIAWKLFETTPPGWARVQAICDFVHTTSLSATSTRAPTRTAWEAFNEGKGVCRDYAHLAIAFCRCMNIPARYCTGYLGDIGMPPPYGADGFRRLVRGLSRRPLVHLRSAQQHAAHRPRADRARPRRRRRADHARRSARTRW